MKKHFLLYVVLAAISLLHPAGEAKAGWNNFIVNFDKNLYGKGSQTWQIAPYDEKWVYFANKNGMVQFDGDGWNIFPLNNGSEVRSILTSSTQNRIYVGDVNPKSWTRN